jgi:hypothetical protein
MLQITSPDRFARHANALIVCSFLLSRLIYYWAGVRFQTKIVWNNFQFIDVALFRDRMWESLYYFHMQPPLMNAITGILVKSLPESYPLAMHILYMAIGLASALLIYRLMLLLNVGEGLALGLTIAFTVSPAVVLSENFPMYEYVMMMLLLASSLVLCRLITKPGFWPSLAFFSLLAALAWIRALYHLYFLVAFCALVVWFVRTKRVAVLAGSIVPLLSVLALYIKNLLVFGIFGASSWLGFNMAVVTVHQLSMDERNVLIESGKLAPIARVEAGGPAPTYLPYIEPIVPTGIPVLDEFVKSNGQPNTNSMPFLKAAPLYRTASKQVMQAYPRAYIRSVLIAWFCYFRPSTDFFQYDDLRRPIYRFDRLVNMVIFGQLREAPGQELRALKESGHTVSLVLYTGIFLMILFPVLLVWSGVLIWRGCHGKSLTRPQLGMLLFITGNIVLIMMTTNLLSSFENNRYRFPTDCLYLILLGTLLAAARSKLIRTTDPVVPHWRQTSATPV